MADPKYAGLPGIVYDQPDVYETSDLPESEQEFHDAYSELADTNPAIEVLHLSGSNSFEKFKNEVLNTNNVDFSDGIHRKNSPGYPSKPIEWSINERGTETVVEKYQRLQCEINELKDEIENLKGTIKHGDGVVSSADLIKNVDQLRSILFDLNLEESLGKEIVSTISDPDVAIQRKLGNLIENFKNVDSKTQKGASNASKAGPPGAITYELYYAPEHAKLTDMAQLAQLEKKLDKIESLLGPDPEQLSSLSAWTSHKSLMEAVRAMSRRMALLEPAHLDHIEGRLHAVHTRMNSIGEKKAVLEDADKQSKVNELFDLMKKSDEMFSLLPEVVDRLSSLEELHHEANQFNVTLKQLDSAQGRLSTSMDKNASLLKDVEGKILENLRQVEANLKTMDDRINKLPKTKK